MAVRSLLQLLLLAMPLVTSTQDYGSDKPLQSLTGAGISVTAVALVLDFFMDVLLLSYK